VGLESKQLAKWEADRDLAERCVSGSREAQRELFRQHRGGVHGTLFRIFGSNSEIEDLIQETFLQVFRSLPSFRGESALASWIGRITTRAAFAHIRARSRRPVALEAVVDIPDTSAPTDESLEARRAVASLYEGLERMDAKYRIAYTLHVIDGRPLREVAEMTEASLTAVKSRVWRARREVNKRAKRDPRLSAYLTRQGVGS
jgi:RNA polymerase sigma-70 factor (ECF subfamily)